MTRRWNTFENWKSEQINWIARKWRSQSLLIKKLNVFSSVHFETTKEIIKIWCSNQKSCWFWTIFTCILVSLGVQTCPFVSEISVCSSTGSATIGAVSGKGVKSTVQALTVQTINPASEHMHELQSFSRTSPFSHFGSSEASEWIIFMRLFFFAVESYQSMRLSSRDVIAKVQKYS